jgi:hypothetical protein
VVSLVEMLSPSCGDEDDDDGMYVVDGRDEDDDDGCVVFNFGTRSLAETAEKVNTHTRQNR